jgi:hypothetical protein
VDALRNPLEHQGRRFSFSRYLHFLEKIYRIFSIFHGKKSGLEDNIFLHFFFEKNLA